MKNFLVLTERKRKKGKISFYISQILDNGLKLIDNDFTCSKTSNRGLKNEVVNFLVSKDILDKSVVNDAGFIDYSKPLDFSIILVEATELCYIDFLNVKYN